MKQPNKSESHPSRELDWSLPDGRSLIAFALALGARAPRGMDAEGERARPPAPEEGSLEARRARSRSPVTQAVDEEETVRWIADS